MKKERSPKKGKINGKKRNSDKGKNRKKSKKNKIIKNKDQDVESLLKNKNKV